MRLPGGIRVRIALVLVAIVAGALGTAYLIVVPSLERRLVDARLSELEELAVPLAQSLPGSRFEWPETVERFDVATNTRVVAFDVVSRTPPALLALADSRPSGRGRTRTLADDEVARRAVTTGEVERGRVVSDMQDYADVAGSRRWARALLSRYAGDERIAFVELKNELEPLDPGAAEWAAALIPYVREVVRRPVAISVPAHDAARDVKRWLAGI